MIKRSNRSGKLPPPRLSQAQTGNNSQAKKKTQKRNNTFSTQILLPKHQERQKRDARRLPKSLRSAGVSFSSTEATGSIQKQLSVHWELLFPWSCPGILTYQVQWNCNRFRSAFKIKFSADAFLIFKSLGTSILCFFEFKHGHCLTFSCQSTAVKCVLNAEKSNMFRE